MTAHGDRASEIERIFGERLSTLPAGRLSSAARAFAAAAAAEGLYVHRAADGVDVPIPAVLSPVVLSSALLLEMSRGARQIATALVGLTGRVLAGYGGPVRERIFGGFGSLERACLERGWQWAERLATARADYFLDADGRPRLLELNATIPAMQGYSDIVAGQAVRALAELSPRPPAAGVVDDLCTRAAGNTTALLRALLRLGGRDGEGQTSAVAILSRRGDSQIGELKRHERRWTAAGHHAVHVWADEVSLGASGEALCRGERFDILYRHVFARRVDPASDLAKILLDPGRHHLFNPVCSHLEAKGMLALLSEAAADEHQASVAGLDTATIDAVRRLVPWTRPLLPGAAVLPDGSHTDDLVAWVRAHRDVLVLKKSWDYGGHGVFLGRDLGPDGSSVERAGHLLGRADAHWDELVDHALVDADLWIVQGLVEARPRRLLLARADAEPEWRDLYVDVSAYASLGTGIDDYAGGAVRAAPGRIVNIQGGGGVAPLLTEDVAAPLADLL
jgi:hypothetical protein